MDCIDLFKKAAAAMHMDAHPALVAYHSDEFYDSDLTRTFYMGSRAGAAVITADLDYPHGFVLGKILL